LRDELAAAEESAWAPQGKLEQAQQNEPLSGIGKSLNVYRETIAKMTVVMNSQAAAGADYPAHIQGLEQRVKQLEADWMMPLLELTPRRSMPRS